MKHSFIVLSLLIGLTACHEQAKQGTEKTVSGVHADSVASNPVAEAPLIDLKAFDYNKHRFDERAARRFVQECAKHYNAKEGDYGEYTMCFEILESTNTPCNDPDTEYTTFCKTIDGEVIRMLERREAEATGKEVTFLGFSSPKEAAQECGGADTEKCNRLFDFCESHEYDDFCVKYDSYF